MISLLAQIDWNNKLFFYNFYGRKAGITIVKMLKPFASNNKNLIFYPLVKLLPSRLFSIH